MKRLVSKRENKSFIAHKTNETTVAWKDKKHLPVVFFGIGIKRRFFGNAFLEKELLDEGLLAGVDVTYLTVEAIVEVLSEMGKHLLLQDTSVFVENIVE